MTHANAVSFLSRLPDDATYGDAIEWMHRMRRVLDRWETLPDHAGRSMTPELKREAEEELDELERCIARNMASSTS